MPGRERGTLQGLMVSLKGGQHPVCASREKTEVIRLDLIDLYIQPAAPLPTPLPIYL